MQNAFEAEIPHEPTTSSNRLFTNVEMKQKVFRPQRRLTATDIPLSLRVHDLLYAIWNQTVLHSTATQKVKPNKLLASWGEQ